MTPSNKSNHYLAAIQLSSTKKITILSCKLQSITFIFCVLINGVGGIYIIIEC